MIQLNPQETFTIVRVLDDHTDVTTYYVQAVIRNAKSDVILDTVNLTDKGDRRFSKDWQVPADVSGEGYYIIITTSVFTDSGYTTKGNYGDKGDTYLVQKRYSPVLGGGGGYIDYKKIEKMILEAVKKYDIEIPEQHKTDLTGIYNSLEMIAKQIESIEIPKQQKTDLSSVLSRIDDVLDAIKEKPVTEIDLSSTHDRIDSLSVSLSALKSGITSIFEETKQMSTAEKEEFKQKLLEIVNEFKQTPFVLFGNQTEKKEKNDYRKFL